MTRYVLLLITVIAATAHSETLIVSADRMFDSESGEVTGPVRVLITDGVIESVNPENVPQDAEVIELGDQTLLPGLIDMHTHLTADYFTGFAPGIHELGPKQGIADGVDEVTKAVRCQAKHGVRVIKVCATGGVFWDEWSVVSPRRRKQMEPREQAIEAALAPGSFISYKR